jgi:lysophospholipid acyltransferase (LPLAT)-like uncharacterized protein
MFRRLTRSPRVRGALGWLFSVWLRLIKRTNIFVYHPDPLYKNLEKQKPVIAAMWHGQHFLVPLARAPQERAAALVSRSGDGELNAAALQALGIRPIRGSGARRLGQRSKGGMAAMRDMLRALGSGEMVVMTADLPKTARLCGLGIVTLARLSGRPIVPVAVVTSRFFTFSSWDRATLALPFGRGAMVIGEPIFVPREADEEQMESARLLVEKGLDAVHARAYTLVGKVDPGLDLNRSRKAY